jgi:hypothetical protein
MSALSTPAEAPEVDKAVAVLAACGGELKPRDWVIAIAEDIREDVQMTFDYLTSAMSRAWRASSRVD